MTASQQPTTAVTEIAAGLHLLVAPGAVAELRAIGAGRRRKSISSGYFDNPETMAAAAAKLDRRSRGAVYVTVNPVDSALLARASNRVEDDAELTTADHDVVGRRWLPVDLDPTRPAGISATDSEHDQAIARAWEVHGWLVEQGWPDPVVVDSGNGAYCLARVDLPNDEAGRLLVERCLLALAGRFDDPAVHVDRTMKNAARVMRLPGTQNRKGDSTPDRPHRPARILHAPATVEPAATVEMVEALAALASQPGPTAARTDTSSVGSRSRDAFDLEGFIKEHLGEFTTKPNAGGGTRWILQQCPFNADHSRGEAWVLTRSNDAIAAGCQHDSCTWGWRELRAKYETGYERNEGNEQSSDQQQRRGARETGQRTKAATGSSRGVSSRDRENETAGQTHSSSSSFSSYPHLGKAAYHGITGKVVRSLLPHTEADPAGLALTFLTAAGNMLGPSPRAVADAADHPGRLNVVLVGPTSRARKGTVWAQIRRLVAPVDPEWLSVCVLPGLASGEALIHQVRDPSGDPNDKDYDPGADDKRCMIFEPEFARLLAVAGREGSTLSMNLRDAYDGLPLSNRTKRYPVKATGVHVSMLAHITEQELTRRLADVEIANGFANRCLFAMVRRSKELPEGGNLDPAVLDALAVDVGGAIHRGSKLGILRRTAPARERWAEIYHEFGEGGPGLAGAVTARPEANTLRLSVLYAALDGAEMVGTPHLEAALAVWRYCEQSAYLIFGDATGDPVADQLLEGIREAGAEGMDGTGQADLFKRNLTGGRLAQARTLLERYGLITTETVPTGGRPRLISREVPR